MNLRTVWLVLGGACCFSAGLRAEQLQWFSDANAINRDSSGALMGSDFEFQLGVFTDDFEPTAANAASWPLFWTPAQSASYSTVTKRFAGAYEVYGNTPPFEEGVKGWIFGRRDGPTGSDWILFRANDWLWPALAPFNPINIYWDAKDATQVVLGTIHSTGTPLLMKSASVRSYAQWRVANLTGEALDDPEDDPDLDGVSNLLEFVFGTGPKAAAAPVPTPVALDSGHAVISIPRRIDHLAVLTVEVSGNLADWNSGPSHTEIVENSVAALVVRDLTPLNSANPKRFIRLKATLPAP